MSVLWALMRNSERGVGPVPPKRQPGSLIAAREWNLKCAELIGHRAEGVVGRGDCLCGGDLLDEALGGAGVEAKSKHQLTPPASRIRLRPSTCARWSNSWE
jgi:hypothetical protein